VQDDVGAGGHAVDAHLPRTRVKQGQHLGRTVAEVFVRLFGRLSLGLPTGAGLWHCLERARLIFTPDIQAQVLAQCVSVFD
jgi:hypothetical protein